MNLGVKDLPISDRPYEKFEKFGAQYLTDAELLAVIIKSGSKELNCVEIAKCILTKHANGLSGFRYLKEASIDELKKIPGIGQVKAIQLKCLIELASRINSEFLDEARVKITSPIDVFNIVKTDMTDKQVEEVKVIILDNKCL